MKEYWYDEMASIGYVSSNRTIKDVLWCYLTIEVTNLPIYPLLLYMVYHLLPPEDIFLMLPSIVLTAAGVYVLVRLTERKMGRWAALFVLLQCITSTTVINRLGVNLRCYSLLFFAAVLFTDGLERLRKKQTKLTVFYTILGGILLIFSHYFGTLYFGILSAIMILLWLRDCRKDGWKWIPIQNLLPFVIPIVLFIPWFTYAMVITPVEVSSFWIAPPTIKNVLEALGYQLGSSVIFCALYGVSYLFIIFEMIKNKKWFSMESFLAGIPTLIIGLIFVYSRFLNPGGGLFENRYFNVLIPFLVVTIAYVGKRCMECAGFDKIITDASHKNSPLSGRILGILWLLVFVAGLIQSGIRCKHDIYEQYDIYAGAGQYIVEQNDLHQENVLLVTTSYDAIGDVVIEGWLDYYVHRQGVQESNYRTVSNGRMISTILDGDLSQFDKIYIFCDYDKDDFSNPEFERTVLMCKDMFRVYERIED